MDHISSQNNRQKCLEYFVQLLTTLPKQYKIESTHDDVYKITPSKLKDTPIAITAITHGEEVIGLHILIELLLGLHDGSVSLERELYLIVANREAYLKDQRYVDTDLNRAYGGDGNILHEEKRAEIIRQVVGQCDYVIDLHQTVEDTYTPFFILPYSESDQNYALAASISPNMPLIVHGKSTNVTTLSSYCTSLNKPALTFEVGGSGVDTAQLELGIDVVKKFLKYNRHKPSNTIPANRPIYQVKHWQKYSTGKVEFAQIFTNFEHVDEGQVIAYIDEEPITTPLSGKILLYPRKWFQPNSSTKPDGIFAILQER